MSEKVFTVRENFKTIDSKKRKEIIRENVIKLIKSQQEKDASTTYINSER